MAERDSKGRFVKGHKQGFTAEKQPKSAGRKKHLVAESLSILEAEGYKPISSEEVKKVYTFLIALDQEKLAEIGKDAEMPMIFRILAKSIFGNKGFDILERMIDRAYGKAINKHEVSGKVETDLSKLSLEELLKRRDALDNE